MNAPLFKAVPQSLGATTNGETTFEFLQRGGRTEAIEIRQWIEDWFREYPDNDREELRKRLQSKKFTKFMGAYFELQVYSVLRRLVWCLVNSFNNAGDGVNDGISGLGPTKRLGMLIVQVEVISYGFLQSDHGAVGASA